MNPSLPAWAAEAVALYESNAASQFILFGNVNDRFALPGPAAELVDLPTFLRRVLLPRFDVVLGYDLGSGLRVEQGAEAFARWPSAADPAAARTPRQAVETLTRYFRYTAALAGIGREKFQVGCVIRAADLLAPPPAGGPSYELNALALLIREWGCDPVLTAHPLATFLLTENLHDLHPLLANNPRAAALKIPLPSPSDLHAALALLAPAHPAALPAADLAALAAPLAGSTLAAAEGLVKTAEYRRERLAADALTAARKRLVEKDCRGLIEFIDSRRTLDDVRGQPAAVARFREDLALWRTGDLTAVPMGYLLCGPVGTGKTFLVDCLAGEAGVPVVRLRNFRDRWVGSTEGNLEQVFRLLRALGRCVVFVDEADQALGRRSTDAADSGLGGRVYAMLAEEMGDPAHRGRVVWCLASSRPDLIEVDLKRPGRIDVKVPLFPAATPREGLRLVAELCRRRGLPIDPDREAELLPLVPPLLTPGAAEAVAVRAYRLVRTGQAGSADALRRCLTGYRPPVPEEVLRFQVALAAAEATDQEFVPPEFR